MTTVNPKNSDLSQQVFDDIKKTRNTNYINNFWRDLSHNDEELYNTWSTLKSVMSEGEIPYLYKEMIYVAVSIANNCNYCIHSHTYAAKKAGMTDVQYKELLSVILMANKTNALATALGTQVDDVLDTSKEGKLRK
jgi:AhpD family alkylhydroperoxidase